MPGRVYAAAVITLLVLIISTFPHRVAHFDDAWGAELAYWLVQKGHVRSEMFQGIGNGTEQHVYVFHKAFTYCQAALLHVLGFDLYAVKTIGLVFSVIGLLLLLQYFREWREARWLATFLYLGCGALISAAFIGRPEPMVMSAGLASFLVLRGAQGRLSYLALAGMLGGLAALAHLHGLIFLMAGGLWLLGQRTEPRGLLAFGMAGTITVSLYLLDATINHELPVLFHQFVGAPVTQSNQHGWTKLQMLMQYQRIYFHSEGEAVLTVFLLVLVLLAWRRGPLVFTMPQQYLLLLVLSFWVLCARADGYYFLLLVPFFVIVAVELALTSWARLPRWRQLTFRLLLALYPLGAGLRAYHLWQQTAKTPWPATENARLARYMPRLGSIAIVPLDFFFDEIGHYRLRGLTAYAMRNHSQYQDTLSVRGFFALAAHDSVEYIVTDHNTKNEVYVVPASAPARIGAYKRVFDGEWHSVYSRIR
jgi:hypothetical protein